MAETTLRIVHREADFPKPKLLQDDARLFLVDVARFCEGTAQGALSATVEVQLDGGDGVAASGFVTLSGVTGTAASGTVTLAGGADGVTVTFEGTAVGPVAAGADDTETAAAVAAALNANATVAALITATSALGVVTLTADTKGTVGNAYTLVAAATSGTATASGATLAGGANNAVSVAINGVTVSTTTTTAASDTAAAAAVAAALNAESSALVDGVITATSALGVVTLTADTKGTGGNWITLSASATSGTATASGARLAGGADPSPILFNF